MNKDVDFSLINFQSYDAYLDSFTTIEDACYLADAQVARRIAKLGYRSTKVPYSEKEFQQRHELAMQQLQPKIMGIEPFSNFMRSDCTDPVLLQFKLREIPIFSKKLSTIVFTTCIHGDGSEMSGYIDLENSWQSAMRRTFKHTNWRAIYEGKTKLKPKPQHLSFRNPRYNLLLYNDSDNFKVVHDHRYGMMFMHRGDHKLIPVSGKSTPFSKNVKRSMVHSPKFGTYIFYDHHVRKKV
ncbi:cilia- and flagella-associated protein 299 [Drosophila sulfurigaster albostrigata]|uniref:cilia- and flagella-associated protein 299 n=1 Tax=Drosophila sulfurigaster albostrigata TaxID=89887 RepID=UPI002D21D343|nr:cilia- and flagella-associated protein 299 [Drosophila sulfurigaster albostrigata]XP_062142607.1 cilia- and flagella-associated protein 299 [Drosophila sulfurigaster albostrigata]